MHSMGRVSREIDMGRGRYLVVPLRFRGFNDATVVDRWRFHRSLLSLYFLLSMLCCFINST